MCVTHPRFTAQVRFAAAADRARTLLNKPDAKGLLHEHVLRIHADPAASKDVRANAAALKRVARALGAEVCKHVWPSNFDVQVDVGME